MYAQLLIDLFKYLSPFLRNAELSKPTQLLYKVRLLPLMHSLDVEFGMTACSPNVYKSDLEILKIPTTGRRPYFNAINFDKVVGFVTELKVCE